MKGRYHVVVQNKRVKFEFEVKRNITLIRGDSATGKTTLMRMIETYERLGEESGITVSCERRLRTLNSANWKMVIEQSQNCIIFIDEETKEIKTKEFASSVRDSNNYYVIITRENLPNLPYSVEEIYGFHIAGKYTDVRQTYNSFYRLYDLNRFADQEKAEVIIAEDTNSGFEFYSAVANTGECISAGGKAKIKHVVKESKGKRILIIADGAAFGPEMEELYLYMQSHPEVCLYLPESFEWIILSSGLIDGRRIADIVSEPEQYVESAEYFSWEQFFTKLLVSETRDTYLQYGKSRLNKMYLNKKEKQALIRVMDVIRKKIGL